MSKMHETPTTNHKITDLVIQFITTLISISWDAANRCFVTSDRTVDIEELPNHNIKFIGKTLVNDEWCPMTTIEIEPYTRQFWHNISDAIILLSGRYRQSRASATELVNTITQSPEYTPFTVERDRPKFKVPKRKTFAGKQEIKGTVTTVGKTTTKHAQNRSNVQKEKEK